MNNAFKISATDVSYILSTIHQLDESPLGNMLQKLNNIVSDDLSFDPPFYQGHPPVTTVINLA